MVWDCEARRFGVWLGAFSRTRLGLGDVEGLLRAFAWSVNISERLILYLQLQRRLYGKGEMSLDNGP